MVKAINISLLFFGLLFSAVLQAATTYSLTINDVKYHPVSGEITIYSSNHQVLEKRSFNGGSFSFSSEEKEVLMEIISSDYHHSPAYVALDKKHSTGEVFVMFRTNALVDYYARKSNNNAVETEQTPTDTTGLIHASFPGGQQALMEYIQKNMRVPDESSEFGLSSKVVLRFHIATDGSISDIEVIKGNYQINIDATLALFLTCPNWIPATRNGTPVESTYTFPITISVV